MNLDTVTTHTSGCIVMGKPILQITATGQTGTESKGLLVQGLWVGSQKDTDREWWREPVGVKQGPLDTRNGTASGWGLLGAAVSMGREGRIIVYWPPECLFRV